MTEFSIGKTIANVQLSTITWLAILLPPTLLYLGVLFHLSWTVRPLDPVLPGAVDQASSILLHLGIGISPMVAAIALYVRARNRSALAARQAFIDDHAGQDLVHARHNPNLVYLVQARGGSGDITSMRLVWTPNGRGTTVKTYTHVAADGVRTFDTDVFLNRL